MTAAGKKRFCADCKKFVHDLSRMQEDEAKALLASSSDLCVRYVYDELGNVVFDIGAQTVRASALTRFAKTAALVALPMSLTACMGAALPKEPAVTATPATTASSTATAPRTSTGGATTPAPTLPVAH